METPDQTVDDAAAPEPATAPAVAAEGVVETEVIDLTSSASEPQADVVDLTESAAEGGADAPTADAAVDAPSVDVLEDQLGQLQGAMDKLQAGDLDGAEQTIKALEDKMSSLRD